MKKIIIALCGVMALAFYFSAGQARVLDHQSFGAPADTPLQLAARGGGNGGGNGGGGGGGSGSAGGNADCDGSGPGGGNGGGTGQGGGFGPKDGSGNQGQPPRDGTGNGPKTYHPVSG